MARFGLGIDRLILRMVACLAAIGMSSAATAQVNEQDRLQRCENNRARMLEIQAGWPAGEAGWSDEQISRARTVIRQLERLSREVSFQISRSASAPTEAPLFRAAYTLNQMRDLVLPFGVSCYPYLVSCSAVFVQELDRKIQAAEAARPERAALLQRFNDFRDNYIALDCVRGAVASASTGDLGFAMMTGTFDSSFGTLTLSTGGGSYDYYGGQVRVSGISGNVMEGTWTQTRAGRQCPDGQYRGRFRFEFTATGFSGSFGYCDEAPGAGVWNGTRR